MAMNNNSSFDPYAVGDGRAEDHGYMPVPVIDMDMNMPVEPPMEVEPEMPFDPVDGVRAGGRTGTRASSSPDHPPGDRQRPAHA